MDTPDTLSKEEWIKHLNLVPHKDEGGYYSLQYISDNVRLPNDRQAMDTIYYMLTDDSPIGHFHKNGSDIVHFFHAGSPLYYTTIDPDGNVGGFWLGPDSRKGQSLQHAVPAGWWKATELREGTYGLISEAVVPSFLAEKRTIATRNSLSNIYPNLSPDTLRLAYE
jgi:predicted cupin superfamily sugar epimerase